MTGKGHYGQAITARLPMVKMAPTIKVFTCSQTGLVKCGANSTIGGNSLAGDVDIRKTPFGEDVFLSLCGLPFLFQRPKLDKAELSYIPQLKPPKSQMSQ
jgi:hypothetical protein